MAAEPVRVPRVVARALAALAALGLAALAAEGVARACGVDFAARSLARVPVYYRKPDVPLDGAPGVFRRAGPHEWRGRPLTGFCLALGVDPSAYRDEAEVALRYDRDGFRNAPDLAAWDVALVGDSFVEAGTLADEATPGAALAAALGLVVKSLGVSHTGTRAHAAYLERFGRSPRCKEAVLVFFEGNDPADLLREELAGLGLDPDASERTPRPHRSALGAARVALLKALQRPRDAVDADVTVGATTWPVDLGRAPPRASELSPATRAALSAALRGFAGVARAGGQRPWLAYAPVKARVLLEAGPVRRRDGAAPPELPAPVADLRPVVLGLAREAGFVGALDLTDALVACARSGQLPYNPVLDVHWTAAGAKAAADAIAAALRAGPQAPETGR